ncbi:MAG TPA: DUF433 domain-containing protein [Gemmatimonadales bacterium]|nr:DUF433 domain-containing protein [Gemmatimonadales bacterium]
MRALHQVIVRSAEVRNGTPVFAGTRIPVRLLLEHLDRGESLEAFVAAHPELDGATLRDAIALAFEALLSDVPLEPGPSQRSLLPRTDATGTIVNAEELTAPLVAGKRVRCPACRMLVFRSWPEGWDGHAAMRCRGIEARGAAARKTEFKRRYAYLFRP